MAFHQTHLIKNAAGTMASKTACGRNIMRSNIAVTWAQSKEWPVQCEKCKASTFFSFMLKRDVEKEAACVS